MSNTYYFEKYKNLNLPKTNPKIILNLKKNELTITSDKLIKNLFIDHKNYYLHFNNNYFDVLPNIPITIKLIE
jgi:beta-mannosidase